MFIDIFIFCVASLSGAQLPSALRSAVLLWTAVAAPKKRLGILRVHAQSEEPSRSVGIL